MCSCVIDAYWKSSPPDPNTDLGDGFLQSPGYFGTSPMKMSTTDVDVNNYMYLLKCIHICEPYISSEPNFN